MSAATVQWCVRAAAVCVFMLCLPAGAGAQVPEIQWWHDLDAPSFGSSAVGDIDGDGMLEIVFGTYFNDEHVYALNAEDGSLLWKYDTGGCNDASPVIADVDLDGALEVIVPASSPCRVFCLEGTAGGVKWSFPTGSNCLDSPPAVADVDADGKPEIVFGAWYGYVYCLNGENGSQLWRINLGTNSYIQSCPTILDVEEDGDLDVVVAQWAGDCRVYALEGIDGSTLWHSDAPGDYMYHGGSAGDIDGDGKMEIAIGCYDNHVYVLNAENGSLFLDHPDTSYIGAPTSLADLNNDGFLEIVYVSYNRVRALSRSGTVLWTCNTGGNVFRGAAIADIDGDGVLDVVFGCDDGILRAVRGDNGAVIWTCDLEAHYGKVYEMDHAPVMADFDRDGRLDVFIIGGHGESTNPSLNHGRAYVLTAGDGGGPGWPMFRQDIRRNARFGAPSGTVLGVPDGFGSIQAAIDAATFGDVVLVEQGTYSENIDFCGKEITVQSRRGPADTIIDGGMTGSVAVFRSRENAAAVLEGFTLTNGSGEPAGSGEASGGGVYCEAAAPTIRNNVIRSNAAAGHGGGVYALEAAPVLAGNIIVENSAGSHGGGIACSGSSPLLVSNTVCGNAAAAGGGLTCAASTAAAANLIMWGNSAASGPQVWLGGPAASTLQIEYSDVEGGQAGVYVAPGSTLGWGAGMLDADPMFAGAAGGDYHLLRFSPCRDSGRGSAAGLPARDFEGDPRVAEAAVDMGGDEFHFHLYHWGAVVPGGAIDIRIAGLPGMPVKVYLGSGVVDPPVPTTHGDRYIALPIKNKWSPGTIPAGGIFNWSVAIPAGAPPGKELPLQALVGPASDPNSPLTNLLLLVVE